MKHQIGESPNKGRRVVQALRRMKMRDAQALGQITSFDIDFVKCFDVVGHERDRHHENSLTLICGKGVKGLVK